ncbi:MAG TPA: hypothetical protein PKY59_18735 [Pyrinomonadaceae bacterium]|nr:hypothetical protein [Pyrinomonadaceae bacterium]
MKVILFIVLAFCTFGSSALFTHLYHREDDMSLRYMLWKKGLYPRPDDILITAVNADRERGKLIYGKSKDEIRQIFPNANKTAVSEYQKFYERELVGTDYLWLDDLHIIVFENDKSVDLRLIKG